MVEANNKGFSKVCYYELLDVDRKAETKAIERVSFFLDAFIFDLTNMSYKKLYGETQESYFSMLWRKVTLLA